MSERYDNNMTGVLFKNEDKRSGKQDADYRGQCEIDRKPHWIDAWINETKDGKKYMRLKFKPKLARGQQPERDEPQTSRDIPFNDEIPF